MNQHITIYMCLFYCDRKAKLHPYEMSLDTYNEPHAPATSQYPPNMRVDRTRNRFRSDCEDMNTMINPLLISSHYLAETTVDVTSEIIGSKGGEVRRQTANAEVIHGPFFKATL